MEGQHQSEGMMGQYETIRSVAESTVQPWLCATDEPIELLARVFWQYDPRNLQLSIRWLNGERMRTADALWGELCAALQFPHWFGWNWNAAIDCLREAGWESRRSYIILVRNADCVLIDDHEAGALAHLAGVFSQVAGNLAEQVQESFDERRPPTPFHVVFHAEGAASSAWDARVAADGLVVPRLPVRNVVSWP